MDTPSEPLPVPTDQLIRDACNRFNSENELVEESLKQLREQFPANNEVSHVLLKVLALNKLYNTRVNDVDVEGLARHIAGLRVDDAIKQGDPAVVERIYTCAGLRMYYSFATKFCSWHNPGAYPIYDSYAEECLWAYRKQQGFATFKRQDCGYYDRYRGIVSSFRTYYGLDHFTFKDIDKFSLADRGADQKGEGLSKPGECAPCPRGSQAGGWGALFRAWRR